MIYTGVSNQYLDTKIFLEAENKANIVSYHFIDHTFDTSRGEPKTWTGTTVENRKRNVFCSRDYNNKLREGARHHRDDHNINLNRSYRCLLHECKRVFYKILENFLAI